MLYAIKGFKTADATDIGVALAFDTEEASAVAKARTLSFDQKYQTTTLFALGDDPSNDVDSARFFIDGKEYDAVGNEIEA